MIWHILNTLVLNTSLYFAELALHDLFFLINHLKMMWRETIALNTKFFILISSRMPYFLFGSDFLSRRDALSYMLRRPPTSDQNISDTSFAGGRSEPHRIRLLWALHVQKQWFQINNFN